MGWHLDRRRFLLAASGALVVPHVARAESPDTFHIAYARTETREAARELLDRIASVLGPEVGRSLVVARHGPDWRVIYDRTGVPAPTRAELAAKVAAHHAELLRSAFDEEGNLAEPLRASELEPLWNVRYGPEGDLEGRLSDWRVVARMLGPGVAKALVVERTDEGTHRLIYRRTGDRPGTERVARHHAGLLSGDALTAVAVAERYHEVVYDGTSTGAGEHLDAPEPEPEPEPEPTVDEAPESRPTTRLTPGSTALRDLINDHIQTLRGRGRVDGAERTAWLVYDLEDDVTLAAINADSPCRRRPWSSPSSRSPSSTSCRRAASRTAPRAPTTWRR